MYLCLQRSNLLHKDLQCEKYLHNNMYAVQITLMPNSKNHQYQSSVRGLQIIWKVPIVLESWRISAQMSKWMVGRRLVSPGCGFEEVLKNLFTRKFFWDMY